MRSEEDAPIFDTLARSGIVVMGAPGCDDAPVVDVFVGTNPKPVTFVYPYYENPKFLARQLENWSEYPRDLLSYLSIIVVDDGSPRSPAEEVIKRGPSLRLKLFRIDVDVRWNWLAARNIGMRHGDDGWRALTDMDHVITEKALHTMVYGTHDRKTIYRFTRTGAKTHPHPNSWFMTREMFWRIGGYDEACSGYYGTDGDYRRRCAAAAPILIMNNATLVCYEHEGDASTVAYKRKQPEDAMAKRIMRARPRVGWRPKTLSFPYHEVTL